MMLLPNPTPPHQTPAGKTIVIVEDERIAAEDVRRRLESWGYNVGAVVASGEEAVQTAETAHPDLMLMDIKLKGKMDGVEAARRIRARTNIPVIYATAHADPATLQRAQVTEPFGLINKPYDDVQMRSAIAMTLFKRSMERQVSEVEDRYRRLMSHTSDLVFVVRERRILNASASAITALGYHPDEILQKDITQFATPDAVSIIMSILAAPAGALPGNPVRVRLQNKAGACLTFDMTVANARQGGDRVMMMFLKDLTAQFVAEEENARLAEEVFEARAEAEEAMRAIRFQHREMLQLQSDDENGSMCSGRTEAGTFHDAKGSLATLRGVTALLLESGLSDRQRRYIDEIRAALQELEFVARGAGTPLPDETDRPFLIRPRDTDVRETVLSLIDRFARVARERDIALSMRVDTDVPPVLRLDADRWTEILTELVGNALRHTHQGEVIVSVHAERGEQGKVTLRSDVMDSGDGIAAAQLPLLFQQGSANDPVFLRTDAPRGVGLRFCKQVIESMGGMITVESQPGKGSTFRCRIPGELPSAVPQLRIVVPPAPERQPDGHAEMANAGPVAATILAGEGMRVLVADDEEINRAVARKMLESLGCAVDVARDGFEAVEAVRSVKYDLVFMDVRMPGLDGFATAAAIRAMGHETHMLRIIAMSADMQESDQHRCIAAGMDDTVEKPLALDLVNLLLKRWRR
jgi:PAS domain S-box-containing protein